MDPRDEPTALGMASVLALVVVLFFLWLILGGGGERP